MQQMKNIARFLVKGLLVLGFVMSLGDSVHAESFGSNENHVIGRILGDGTGTDLFAGFRPSESDVLWKCFDPVSNQIVAEIESSSHAERSDQEVRFETQVGQISIPHQELGGNGKAQALLIDVAQSLVCYPN
jgi:hypothetical protein